MARHSKHSFEIGVMYFNSISGEAYVKLHRKAFKHDQWNVMKLDCLNDCIFDLENLYDEAMQENRTKDAEMRKARECA